MRCTFATSILLLYLVLSLSPRNLDQSIERLESFVLAPSLRNSNVQWRESVSTIIFRRYSHSARDRTQTFLNRVVRSALYSRNLEERKRERERAEILSGAFVLTSIRVFGSTQKCTMSRYRLWTINYEVSLEFSRMFLTLAIVINVFWRFCRWMDTGPRAPDCVDYCSSLGKREARSVEKLWETRLPASNRWIKRRIHFGEDVDGEKCSTTRIPFVSLAI